MLLSFKELLRLNLAVEKAIPCVCSSSSRFGAAETPFINGWELPRGGSIRRQRCSFPEALSIPASEGGRLQLTLSDKSRAPGEQRLCVISIYYNDPNCFPQIFLLHSNLVDWFWNYSFLGGPGYQSSVSAIGCRNTFRRNDGCPGLLNDHHKKNKNSFLFP